ncbi:Secreted protein [Nostocoides japonicum T1-X7]|uniref:Secreted protein n=1 Tax=Nostocoides japonicum T1-X7 TaxID=1194083 RepID=A0A077LX27_9MICO|nr:hypothetical protein [Tetrasphaera japonica]CCH78468.1 Secreted protein [Tetrasphaera japonica T1-X7]
MRRSSVLAASAVVLVGAGGVLAGCSSPVEVAVPPSSPACRTPAWPSTVAGHERVDTSPSSPRVAAWGDPAVIARCGVAALAPTTDQCVEVSGVDWVAVPLSDGAKFTTFGTTPALEVLVPSAYAPEPLLLPAFAAVAKSLPTNGLTCR